MIVEHCNEESEQQSLINGSQNSSSTQKPSRYDLKENKNTWYGIAGMLLLIFFIQFAMSGNDSDVFDDLDVDGPNMENMPYAAGNMDYL